MKTKNVRIETTLNVYACPSDYWVPGEPESERFSYVVRLGDCYTAGAVKIFEQKVDVFVPDGINLLDKTIEKLEADKVEAKEDYVTTIAKLDILIDSLKVIEYKPEPKLVHYTGVEVEIGDVVKDSDDIDWTIQYFKEPHKSSSVGHVTVYNDSSSGEFYVSVFNMRWINR